MSTDPPCNEDQEAPTPDPPLAQYRMPQWTSREPEALITIWWDGSATVAYKQPGDTTWGPPYALVKVDP